MKGYESHESFWADVLIYWHMLRRALLIGLFCQIIYLGYFGYELAELAAAVLTIDGEPLPLLTALKYVTGISLWGGNLAVEPALEPYAKGWPELPLPYYRAVADYATSGAYADIRANGIKMLWQSLYMYGFSALYFFGFWYFSVSQKSEKFLRGIQTTPLSVMSRQLAKAADKAGGIRIGETTIPRAMEPKHTLILGASGSGKGVLMTQMLVQIINRRDRMVIYDPKGEFTAKLYRPQAGDIIFSPFDGRSTGWSIFSELRSQPDYDIIAKSLFLPPDSRDSYWYSCAGDVFRAGLIWLKLNNQTSNAQLWDFFSQPLTDIQAAFRSLPVAEQGALKHIDQSDSPTSASIISILQERIQVFRYLRDLDGDASFSFAKYIQNGKGNIFLLGNEKNRSLMKPLLSMAIDIMCREMLSLPDQLDRRLFFVVDELGTLNRMESILNLETVGRSKGACLICANQDLGRIEEVYGRANLKTFFNNFGTNFIFRLHEPETAEFLSRAIGEKQTIKRSQSSQLSPNDTGDRKSFAQQEKTERIIMPTELGILPDRHAILRIAGYGTSQIVIPPVYYPQRQPPYVEREFPDFEPAPALAQAVSATPQAIANKLRI